MQWTIREPVEDNIHGIQEHSSFDEVVKTKCEELLDIGMCHRAKNTFCVLTVPICANAFSFKTYVMKTFKEIFIYVA